MMHKEKLIIPILIAAAMIGFGLLPFVLQSPLVKAAPEEVRVEVSTLNSSAIATTTTWSGGRWSALGRDTPPTIAEIYWFVDIGASVNTTTFVLQVSPDNSTWVNHSTASALATNVAVDTNAYTRTTVEGVYYRVQATATNTNTLTPTIKVLLR